MGLVAIIAIEFALFPAPFAAAASLLTFLAAVAIWSYGARAIWPIWLAFCALVVLGALSIPFLAVVHWSGTKNVTLRFDVLDVKSERAIRGARIRLMVPHRPDLAEARTAADGRAEVSNGYLAGGTCRGFSERGAVIFEEWWVEVSAEGYDPKVVSLAEFTGRARSLQKAIPPPIGVSLERTAPAGGGPLAELAGEYFLYRAEIGLSLKLTADGRYSFATRGGGYVSPSNEGAARLVGGSLMLEPAIPNKWLPKDLVPLRWGERTYLVDPQNWTFPLGAEPRAGPFGEVFLRNGDWDREASEMPDLPDRLDDPVREEKRRRAAELAGEEAGSGSPPPAWLNRAEDRP
jgi:hypothetical protein